MTESAHGRLARRYPAEACEACGSRTNLTRHHVVPRSRARLKGVEHPARAFMILCRPCHDILHDAYTNSECSRDLNSPEKVVAALRMIATGSVPRKGRRPAPANPPLGTRVGDVWPESCGGAESV